MSVLKELALVNIIHEILDLPDSLNHPALTKLREIAKEWDKQDKSEVNLRVTFTETKTITVCPWDFELEVWPYDPAEYVRDRFQFGDWNLAAFDGGDRTMDVEVKKAE